MTEKIILNKLKLEVNDNSQEISLSFGVQKIGLVGKNGIGKTSLLKLIVGESEAISGKIIKDTQIAYLPQDYQFNLKMTIAQTLGIQEKLEAIEEIKAGTQSKKPLEIIDGDFDIESRAEDILQDFNLQNINLYKKLEALSGGERMKVALAKLFLFPGSFIIMDEPTNNLDRESRQILYQKIQDHQGGMLVVSHDRELLSLMEQILELSIKGIKIYGGNYQMYENQKLTETEVTQRVFTTTKQEFKKVKKQAQAVKEKQEKRTSHAAKRAETQKIPKILLGGMIERGQKTAANLKNLHDQRILEAENKFNQAKENILPQNEIYADLSKTEVPKGKLMVKLEGASFAYENNKQIIKNLSLDIYGQERLAVTGKNGSGKTTLLKLIAQTLVPQTGSVKLGTEKIAYLDQEVRILDARLTILENVVSIGKINQDAARKWLAGFLFLKRDVFKKVGDLSGGERIRAGLAAVLSGERPAELLILDEPTNNLDLDSIEQIESALQKYKGTLLVISHDQNFLENIGVERYIDLN